jgi:hypothetical protein
MATTKKINFKGLNSVGKIAEAMGRNPKVARAKMRRAIANNTAPVAKINGLTETQAKKVADYLTTDHRRAAE